MAPIIIEQKLIMNMLDFLKNYYPLTEEPKIIGFIVPEREWKKFNQLYIHCGETLEKVFEMSSELRRSAIITKRKIPHWASIKESKYIIDEYDGLWFQTCVFTNFKYTEFGHQIDYFIKLFENYKYGIAIRGISEAHKELVLMEELLHIIEAETDQNIFTDNLKTDAELVNLYFREYNKIENR